MSRVIHKICFDRDCHNIITAENYLSDKKIRAKSDPIISCGFIEYVLVDSSKIKLNTMRVVKHINEESVELFLAYLK